MCKIDKNITIEELVKNYPESVRLFVRYKLPCIACGEVVWGTLGEILEEYNVDTEKFIEE